MKEKRNIKKETLFRLILREVKKTSKSIPEGKEYSYVKLAYSEITNGSGMRLREEVTVGDLRIQYTDDKLTSTDFCGVVKDAIRKAGLLADLRTEKRWKENGFVKDEYEVFMSLKMLAPPCKSFKTLKRMLQNHIGDALKETAVYSAKIQGMRDVWSENECRYLCHNEELCNEAKGWLVKCRRPRERVSFGVVNSMEIDKNSRDAYRIDAQWCGENKYGLEIKIVNTYGRKNAVRVFYV